MAVANRFLAMINDGRRNAFFIDLYMISDCLANTWSKSQDMGGTGKQYCKETSKSLLKRARGRAGEPL